MCRQQNPLTYNPTQVVRRFTLRDIEMIMLLAIEAGMFSTATGAGQSTGTQQWRVNVTDSEVGPMNEERSLLLLSMSRRTFWRGNNWREHLHRTMTSAVTMGIMLEVSINERDS